MNIIKVHGIRAYSYHGCMPEEERIGGYYEVDVDLWCDFKYAAVHDSLTETIDYVAVNKIVEHEMAKPSKLIETVAYRIVESCKDKFSILQKVRVEIRKINPPINGDVNFVAVVIEE